MLIATTALLMAAVANACPVSPPQATGSGMSTRFGIQSLRTGTAIQFAAVQAAHGSLLLNLPKQGATCDKTDDNNNHATFYIDSAGSLFLNRDSATPQEIYVVRDGMGQGVIGYTTGAQPLPRNAERSSWAIADDGTITFNTVGLIACPGSIDGAWSIWVATGVDNPGGNTGCTPFTARQIIENNPDSCMYTSGN